MMAPDRALSVAAALGAAAAFGLASALQHAESSRATRRGALDPALVAGLVRRPLWLLGTAADVLAVVLQTVALRFGPVSLVQPLLVAGLPAAVVVSCVLAGWRRPHRSEILGVLLSTLGLLLLAPALASAGLAPQPRRGAALIAGVVVAAVTLVLLLLARRRPRWAGLAIGAAAGLVIGAGSVLLAVSAARIGDPGRLLSSVAPYATVGVGLLGLVLSQAAFQTGSLGAPLATLSVVEPAAAVLLAVTVLHEKLTASGPTLLLGLAGVVVAVAGVLLLARAQDSAPAAPVAHGGTAAAG